MKHFFLILLAVTLFLMGCMQTEQLGEAPAETETPQPLTPEPLPSPSKTKESEQIGGVVQLDPTMRVPLQSGEFEVTPMPEVPEHLRSLVEQTIADLTERLDVAESAIEFVRADAVDWPDSSLGCPEPGMMYTQVITPGYQVILQAEDDLYFYHSGGAGGFKYCPDATPVAGSGAGD
jgi:hypothetical protein